MLSIEQMRRELQTLPTRKRETLPLPLAMAAGHHLAKDVFAAVDTPPFANSAMDGFAVRFSDLSKGTLAITQRIAAGSAPTVLARGCAARIFTGAPLPDGADTVVIQEDCEYNEDNVSFLSSDIKFGDNIRHKGEDLAKGQLIGKVGQKVNAPLIGVLASQGIAQVDVFKRLSIALVSTGDELTPIGEPLKPGSIYDSNRHMINALLEAWGKVECQHIQLADNLAATKDALSELTGSVDLIFTFGGVSVGEEDHIKQAVSELGEIQSWKVKLKPGKPLMIGLLANGDSGNESPTPILGLPGNPLSAFVTFLLFGQTLLNHLSFRETPSPFAYPMPLGFAISSARRRPELVRVRIENGKLVKNGNQSSGALASLIDCDGLALVPSDICLEEGSTVDFYPLSALLYG